MGRNPTHAGWKQIDRLFESGSLVGLTDRELLRRFLAGETAEAAFEALVNRHGPMVRAVCRSMLGDPHEADDAFQATFLVLARRAGSIRRGDAVGSWLYGVAHRVAARRGPRPPAAGCWSATSPNVHAPNAARPHHRRS